MVYGAISCFVLFCGIWGIYQLYVLQLGIKKLSLGVVVVLAIVSGISYKLYGKYEIEKFQDIHNNDMVLAYIDSMSTIDLKNKLKACQINSNNCTIVFPQK